MAFGTDTVPRVDRIIGPGNAYVAEAKLQVSGAVAIDSPAGPSELLVIGDATSDAAVIARELLAQAEHDPRACVVAVMTNADRAKDVIIALREMLPAQPRRSIIEAAIAERGAVLWTENMRDAVAFANEYAPEHLLLALASAEELVSLVRNAGTIFVGETASVAFGDYMTGANHVLPTGGLARSYSGLSVLDFMRWTTYQRVDFSAAAALARPVAAFAEAEALPGHALAARAWMRDSDVGRQGDG
jgi:histidinol dehydrogenase